MSTTIAVNIQTVSAIISIVAAIIAPLVWIGRSCANMAIEMKTVSMIVRTCPNCQTTVQAIDHANGNSRI